MSVSASRHYRYECQRCGNCCRWPGYVRVTAKELEAIASFLDMTAEVLTQSYTALTDDRRSLTLVEQPNGHCIFLDADGDCMIYPVRPKQCRDFPDKWTVPDFENRCSAVKICAEPR